MNQGVVIGEERLGKRVAARLLDEIIEHPPPHVAVPRRLDVAEHLINAGTVQPGQRHAVALVDVTHQTVADRQVDFGVRRVDGEFVPLRVLTEQDPVGVSEGSYANGK